MSERLYLTENEKLAQAATGLGDHIKYNMQENNIDTLIKKEKANKFNSQVDAYKEALEENNKKTEQAQNEVQYDIEKAELKPMFSRIIVKPLAHNPFQKVQMQGSLIVDAGGYTPHAELNPVSGQYEEQKEFIVTGCVVEVGPETKYLKEGDVVYYRRDTVVPVPFFKQGLVKTINRKSVFLFELVPNLFVRCDDASRDFTVVRLGRQHYSRRVNLKRAFNANAWSFLSRPVYASSKKQPLYVNEGNFTQVNHTFMTVFYIIPHYLVMKSSAHLNVVSRSLVVILWNRFFTCNAYLVRNGIFIVVFISFTRRNHE